MSDRPFHQQAAPRNTRPSRRTDQDQPLAVHRTGRCGRLALDAGNHVLGRLDDILVDARLRRLLQVVDLLGELVEPTDVSGCRGAVRGTTRTWETSFLR